MWISDFAIKKPIITVVMMLALVVFGLVALWRLNTDEFPEINAPVVSITIPYPGASPAVVERELVVPLEEQLQSISGIDKVQSTAVDGYAAIVVFFDFEKNLQEATQDIRDKISAIRNELPTEIKEPTLSRFSASDFPIVSLTLTSETQTASALTELADPGIKRALTALPGVADVSVIGGIEREMSILVRPDDMAAYGISVADIAGALQSANLAAPVGKLDGPVEERTIRLRGRLVSAADFEQIVIKRDGDRLVRLGNVARAEDGHELPRTAALYNGKPAVSIDIKKSTGFSTTDVSARLRKKVAELQKTLPPGTRLEVVRDSGTRVASSVSNVQASLLEGALLTVLVVFVFLKSWRSTLITSLALPVSVIASFIAVLAFGFTLNTMSLLGLSLAIGILIDDAIVVRENIVRHMEMGKDHHRAAAEGTAEIGLAVAATTFSIVVVFVPIAFMGGVAEQWFAPFALTIACSVLVSLFVSFTLDPMLSAVWEDPDVIEGRRSALSRKLDVFDRAFTRLTHWYRGVIRWALGHRLLMVVIALVSFFGALAIPATGLVGSAFMPIQDRSEFSIQLETPPGSSLAYTQKKTEYAAALAAKHPEVKYTYATIGGQGNTDTATIYVRLVPKDERKAHQDDVAQRLREEIRTLSGVTAFIANGFDSGRQIQIQLTGPDTAVLGRLADDIAARVATIPGAVDVGLSSKGVRRELDVALKRDIAGQLGVSAGALAQALRLGFAGVEIGDWIDPTGHARNVMVRLDAAARQRPSDVESLPIPLPPSGRGGPSTIPLGQVATLSPSLGPAQIEHLDGERVITVGANVEGKPLSAVLGEVDKMLKGVEMPAGYSRKQGGESEDQNEVFTRIMIALGTAVVLMYLILVVQFGSFLEPIPIMASLPMSLIGVMLAMLVTGSTLNLMSMIGVILLMGIVAKNAILLIDFAKHAEASGMNREEAIIEAGGVRLRPIVMTSVAIIAGMLPVAIGAGEGGDFRAPLGRAVIGGVITSTVLTLLIIPTFYDILTHARDGVLMRLFGRKPGQARAQVPGETKPESHS